MIDLIVENIGCTLHNPQWISLYPGQKYTFSCPVHGKHTVTASGPVW